MTTLRLPTYDMPKLARRGTSTVRRSCQSQRERRRNPSLERCGGGSSLLGRWLVRRAFCSPLVHANTAAGRRT
jgi:hypothetical protein